VDLIKQPHTHVLETLHTLQVQAAARALFGADSHGFQLNPRLEEHEIAAFEARFSIRLPSDYRDFLSHVGNGGAGPFYGVFPLGYVDDNHGLRKWDIGDDLVGILAEPFQFRSAWNDLSQMPVDERVDQDQKGYDRLMNHFEKSYWSSSLVSGSIPICHKGCALRILLVVTGKQAGMLWEDLRSEYGGLKPLLLKCGSPATFQHWYDEWLDACLATLNKQR